MSKFLEIGFYLTVELVICLYRSKARLVHIIFSSDRRVQVQHKREEKSKIEGLCPRPICSISSDSGTDEAEIR